MPLAAPSSVRPAYLWVPPGSLTTSGDEAAQLAESLGFDVDQPERDVLSTLLSESPSGGWATLETAVICARQNIKTWALLMTVLHDLYLRDVKRVTWSSHLFKTTADAFNELDRLIGDTDWMRKRVRRRRASAGQEGFDFVNGATIDFLARSKGAGRGLSGSTVILDEALFLSSATQGALIPTLSAQPNPHVRYGSSPGVLESQALRSIRNRGRAGGDPSLSYIEYTSEREACANDECVHQIGASGCQLDNEEKWAQANPALGRRIPVAYVRDERRALSAEPVEFMRERLGWWEDPPDGDSTTVYPLEAWNLGADPESAIAAASAVAWSVDVSWDRSTAYVAVAGRREDGEIHAQLVHSCDPAAVAAYLGDRVPRRASAGLALQGSGAPVSSLLDDITRALDGLCDITAMSGADVSRACGVMFDAVRAQTMRHADDIGMDRSVLLAVSRPLGDGWALDRKRSPVDIANLVALTNAVWLLSTTDEPGDPGVWFM